MAEINHTLINTHTRTDHYPAVMHPPLKQHTQTHMRKQNGKEREMKILCFYNVEAEIDEGFGLLLNRRQKWRPKSFPNIL